MNKSILTNNFKLRTVLALKESFSQKKNNLYFFYARPFNHSGENADVSIEAPLATSSYETALKSNIIALKRVDASDLAIGVRRHSWQTGETYFPYDDSQDLSNKKFYVISQNNVFLCIDNNMDSPSISNPSDSELETDKFTHTSDGYVWKYLYTLPVGFTRKFNIVNYIPIVENEDVKNGAIPGTINRIEAKVKDEISIELLPSTWAPSFQARNEALTYIPLFVHGSGKMYEAQGATIGTNNGIISALSQFNETGIDNTYLSTPNRYIPFWIRSETNTGATNQAYFLAKLNEDGLIDTSTIEYINRGEGYSNGGPCTIVQSSCLAYILFTDSGQIKRVEINEHGRDFLSANVVPVVSAPHVNNFDFHPIISPTFGYGASALTDLQATTLLTNVRIAYEEEGGAFSTQNEFRSIGLISGVKEYFADESIEGEATSLTLTGMTTLLLDSVPSTLSLDDVVSSDNGARGRVVDIFDNKIRIIQPAEDANTIPFEKGFNLTLLDASETTLITDVIRPSYSTLSGSLLYIDNRQPISRNPDQIETINFILSI